jgi:hypothetical protein
MTIHLDKPAMDTWSLTFHLQGIINLVYVAETDFYTQHCFFFFLYNSLVSQQTVDNTMCCNVALERKKKTKMRLEKDVILSLMGI